MKNKNELIKDAIVRWQGGETESLRSISELLCLQVARNKTKQTITKGCRISCTCRDADWKACLKKKTLSNQRLVSDVGVREGECRVDRLLTDATPKNVCCNPSLGHKFSPNYHYKTLSRQNIPGTEFRVFKWTLQACLRNAEARIGRETC